MMKIRSYRQGGFTLVELLVVIAIIGVMVGLLLPAVQAAREAARRMQCSNKLKQLGLAMHNYESTYGFLPPRKSGTTTGTVHNSGRLTGSFIGILPFIEEGPLYDRIAAGDTANSIPPWGPSVWSGWAAWDNSPAALRCPSDPAAVPGGRLNSYSFSVGDQAAGIRDAIQVRGLFGRQQNGRGVAFREITDGLSNTVMMSERLIHPVDRNGTTVGAQEAEVVVNNAEVADVHLTPSLCLQVVSGRFLHDGTLVYSRTGRSWNDAQANRVAFNTILGPNGPSCLNSGTSGDQSNLVIPPTSRHPGGVNAVVADGSVRFIPDSIDAGDSNLQPAASGLSRYGVWGALGSKDGGESVQMP